MRFECKAEALDLLPHLLGKHQPPRFVHEHPVSLHFDGAQQAAHVEQDALELACLAGTLDLRQGYALGVLNVAGLPLAVLVVAATQVAGQQGGLDVTGVDACCPQGFDFVNLERPAVTRGHLVQA